MTKPINDLDAAEVRHLFTLDAERGVLIRRVAPNHHPQRIGEEVGTHRCDGYLETCIHGRRYLVHRLVWLHLHGVWPDAEIDHIDLNKANNCVSNLREATRSLNLHNTRVRKSSSVGVKGVTFDKKYKRYRAQINTKGKRRCLGRYATAQEAGEAYRRASIQLYGAYSCFAAQTPTHDAA